QLLRQHLRLSPGGGKTSIDADIVTLRPSEPLEFLSKFRGACFGFRIVLGEAHQHRDVPHALALLRTERQRPRRGRANKRDEFAPVHSITSSARASSVGGTSRPSALAVFRLIVSLYVVGAWIGRSAGFSPFKMRST